MNRIKHLIVAFATAIITIAFIFSCGEPKKPELTIYATSFAFDQKELIVQKGFSESITLLLIPGNANSINLIWESKDPSTARVDDKGVVTGIEPGLTTVSAIMPKGKDSITSSCRVRVIGDPKHVADIVLDRGMMILKSGESSTLTAIIIPETAENKKVSWQSSDPNIASVDANGKVTALLEGKAIITVTAEDGNKTASCEVTVGRPEYSRKTDSLALVAIYNCFSDKDKAKRKWNPQKPINERARIENDRVVEFGIWYSELKKIPAEIGMLSELRVLDLEQNQIESLPPEIGELTNLIELKLKKNRLTTLPPEIGKLTKLEKLEIKENKLTSIPSEIGGLVNLPSLDLSNNKLTSIPSEIGKLINILDLDLSNNELSSIPPEIGNLSENLTILILKNNKITTLPTELSNLKKLFWLDVSFNKLTKFPIEITSMQSMKQLILSNNSISGEIPNELSKYEILYKLELNNNNFTGSIPPEIGKLKKLWELDLSNNKLSGSIPKELCYIKDLRSLSLDHNNLTGSIPPEIGQLGNLWYISLNNNSLSGAIPPELGNAERIGTLRLNDNNLTGTIPPELGKITAAGRTFNSIFLQGNRLTGKIPKELKPERKEWKPIVYNPQQGGVILETDGW